jgi:PAS domain-containing protein
MIDMDQSLTQKIGDHFFSDMPLLAFALDADGMILLVKGGEILNMRLDPAAIVGTSVFVNRKLPINRSLFRRVMAGEKVCTNLTVDKTVFETNLVPMRDDANAIIGLIGWAINVTVRLELEQKLDEERFKTKEALVVLEKRTQEIHTIFSNINQGICLIDQEFKINPEYSSALETILKGEPLKGRNILDILGAKAHINQDQLQLIETTLHSIMGSNIIAYMLNSHILPTELEIEEQDGIKFLEVDWTPIANADDIIARMMITLRDVTDIKRLKQEAESSKTEMEIFYQLSNISFDMFNRFIESASRHLKTNSALLYKVCLDETSDLILIKRNLHTLKGDSRTYQFSFITEIVHEVENLIAKQAQNLESGRFLKGDMINLIAGHERIEQVVNQYISIYHRRFKSMHEESQKRSNLLREIIQTLENIDDTNENRSRIHSKQTSLKRLQTRIIQVEYPSLQKIFEGFKPFISSMASELGITAPNLVYQASEHWYFRPETAENIQSALTHLIRNSLGHGFKSMKDHEHSIIVKAVTAKNGNLIVDYADDGIGLDLNKIKAKALKNGLIQDESSPDEDICNLIFHPGFTTAEMVTSIYGRGIGMNAVLNIFKEMEGVITLVLREKRDASNYAFRLRIEIPSNKMIPLTDRESA